LPAGGIWFQAASVGEVKLIGPLIDKLKLAYPRKKIIVSVITAEGKAVPKGVGGRFNHSSPPGFPRDRQPLLSPIVARFIGAGGNRNLAESVTGGPLPGRADDFD